MTFEPISCNSLHACWPVVRKGLERILEKSKAGWIPEDVYDKLRNGKAMLVFGREGPHVVGFFVVEQVAEPFSGRQYLNCWALEAERGALRKFKDVAFAEIDRITKVQGLPFWRMRGRLGWLKPLRGYMTPICVEFERVVT